jgi:hypothetical protein
MGPKIPEYFVRFKRVFVITKFECIYKSRFTTKDIESLGVSLTEQKNGSGERYNICPVIRRPAGI